ncbi:YheC/YheD family protein [Cytobacillus suaedae]|nr:YheC/YheD family protein [Cytobacillus suaedae]
MNWVQIKKISSEDNSKPIIYLPSFFLLSDLETINLNFGKQKKKVIIKILQVENPEHNHFTSPITVSCSETLLNSLHIQEDVTYKLYIQNEELFLGPVIGLLLGEQHYYYHHRHMQEYSDALSAYDQVGGLVIAFKECSIDWEKQCLFGLFFHAKTQKWKYGKLPIPSVIYRRGFKLNQQVTEKLSKLTNNNVFNSFRYDKWELYQKLAQHKDFKHFLPDTKKIIKNKDVVNAIMEKSKIILKPADLSRGRGIYILKNHTADSVMVIDYNDGDKKELIIPNWALETYLDKEQLDRKNYIIQPYLDLAKIDGDPWDIRVVMQKNYKSEWQCSGIECRVAGKNQFVTNISRGGSALSIKEALELSFGLSVSSPTLKKKVITVAKTFCESMDQTGEHFAEFGLDLAFDVNKRLWFIEANMRPTFNGFKKMDMANYYYICQNPLRYAAAIGGFIE